VDDVRHVRDNLASSLDKFTTSSSIAIRRLYAAPRRRKNIMSEPREGDLDGEYGADLNGALVGPNETVFLIYL
jgi:hypothetical protein